MKNIIFVLLLLCFGCTSTKLTPREQMINDVEELVKKYAISEIAAAGVLYVLYEAMLTGDEKELFYVVVDFSAKQREELKKRKRN